MTFCADGPSGHKPVAIIDIGSNSIRLVVYDALSRNPVPLFNEKATCALGLGMGRTGRLNPDGVPMAQSAVARFVRLARAMAVERLDILATAAVRDAEDGAAFVTEIERRSNVEVQILSGGEEARMAALGVLCGTPEARGIVADLGGGSLELVQVDGGALGDFTTMPLGVLRLSEASGGDRAQAAAIIAKHLAANPWIKQAKGQTLYAVGGAWRAIARICIAQTGHPLQVLDNFTLDLDEAERLIDLISRQSRKSLEKIPGVAKRRIVNLPLAALLLEKLLEEIEPARLVFSVYGMREGRFYSQMPKELQEKDPLLAACKDMARSACRFPEHSRELLTWMDGLFAGESREQRRLRHAACLLSDVFWSEHPDYRGEQAFLKVLRLPFMGLGHRDRASLALSVFARYQRDDETDLAARARGLLDDETARRARITGQALHLGHTISGGAPDLLKLTKLSIQGPKLVLELPAGDPAFPPDIIGDRRFDKLAKTVGCESLELRWV